MTDCQLGICKCYPPHPRFTEAEQQAIGRLFDRMYPEGGNDE